MDHIPLEVLETSRKNRAARIWSEVQEGFNQDIQKKLETTFRRQYFMHSNVIVVHHVVIIQR